MEDILNATLAGGVSVGIVNSVCYYPVVGLVVGLLSGVISTLSFHYLGPYFQRKVGLHDSCGILSLHVLPGIFGAIASTIVVACYNNGFDNVYTKNFASPNIWESSDDFGSKSWKQFSGMLVSVGFGLLMGVLCGLTMARFYDERI